MTEFETVHLSSLESTTATTGELAQLSSRELKLCFGGYSCAGPKPENQDAFAAHLPSGSARNYKGGVACLADGASCSDRAQQASSTAVTLFIEDYFSTPDTWPVKTAAARVLSSLNSWLCHHGNQGGQRSNGLVTTFSALVVKSNTAHLLHAGDSRIYRLRGDGLELLTRDHCHHQGGHKVFITRALGMDSHLELDYRQEPVAVADVFLLTSDGVHEWLSDRDLAMLLAEQLAQGVDLEAAAYALVQAAERAGADDNLTALLVRVDELPIADLDEVHRNLTALAIPPVLEPGQKLDHYEVQKVLHAGTRSHIYRVRDLHSHQSLVLKAPSENFADDAQYLEGFIREQWVGRRISHPGVMKILARPEDSRFLYHLCEYIDGITLRQWLYDHPKPDLKTVRELTAQLVGGLRAFQRLSMVHRDLKPENVIIDPQGRLVIVDFGTVYVAGLGEICSPLSEEVPVGSVDYIAPEYVLGEPCTECSDFFSLAVMVYELLCGQLPFDLPDLQRKPPKNYDAWRYISVRSRRADLPLWLDLALQKALSARPSQRQAAFSEFLQDLEKPNAQLLANHQQVPLIERNPLVFWRSVSLLLLLVIIVQWLWMAH